MISARPTRMLFVAVSLRQGGAERVTSLLLQRLAAARRYELHLALLEPEGPFLIQLPDDVAVHPIGSRRPLRALLSLFRLLRRLQPDVIFSNGFPINLLTTSLKPFAARSSRLVLREVNVLDVLLRRGLGRVLLQHAARRSFPRADAIICQSRFMEHDLRSGLRIDQDKLVTIFNPVDFDAVAQRRAGSNPLAGAGPGPHLLGVGQLVHKKGFDRVIAALPALLSRAPDAQLWLVGDGPARNALRQQAAALGLSGRVHLVGATDNPFAWMHHADLFVLASRHEGTPNVLLEAIACEAPIVILDHPGGTREVMDRTGQGWRIVSDLAAWNPRWFDSPPADALSRAREFLDVSHVAQQYVAVLEGAPPLPEAA